MKRSTLTLGMAAVALSACGGGSLGNSGAAGSSGATVGTGEGATGGTATVGTAGASGSTGGAVGGTGGTGATGGLPACTFVPVDSVSFAIAGPDGMLVGATVTAAVTVAAVESCAAVGCPVQVDGTTISATSTRVRLSAAAGGSEWTLYLFNSAMPAGYLEVGDAFDMTIDAKLDTTFYPTTDQILVLERNGDVVLFAADLQRFGSPPLPNLLPFEIAVSDAGSTCQISSFICPQRSHALRVSIATDANVVVARGESATIGGMSITNGGLNEFIDTGGCDSKSSTTFAGFRLAGAGGTGGTGGATGGAGGTSGVGGGGGACIDPTPRDFVEVAITGADGAYLTTAVNAPVTVTSVASCTSTTCALTCPAAYCPQVTTAATRITLEASTQERWTLYLRNTAMPADVIEVGDNLHLAVNAALDNSLFTAINQTVMLSRDGYVVAFAANIRQHFDPPLPNFLAAGLTIEDRGAVCELAGTCVARRHDARVTAGNESRYVANGTTITVGDYSFTNGGFTEYRSTLTGCSDAPKSEALMAGFRVR
jgi:hypothetical protein